MMTDAEIDALLKEIEAILDRGYLMQRVETAMRSAHEYITALRDRRNELQKTIDEIAGLG